MNGYIRCGIMTGWTKFAGRVSRPRCPTRTHTVFLGLVLAAGLSLGQTARGALSLTASLDKQTYVSGEEICLTLTFHNEGKSKVPLLKVAYVTEDVLTWELRDARTGKRVPDQVRSELAGGQDDPVLLDPGRTLVRHFDLHHRYPNGLRPGRYELSMAYHCSAERYPTKMEGLRDVHAVARPVRFLVTPRSASEEAEYRRYTSLRARSAELCIQRCQEALRLEPEGLFARRTRIRLAGAYWRSGQLDEAIAQSLDVAGDPTASPATQAMANRSLGLVYHEQGDLQAAIEAMQRVDTRQARIYCTVWNKELQDDG